MSKKKSTGHFSRYWFVLKQGVLFYYNSPNESYFPTGIVDLKHATRVEPEIDPNTGLEVPTFFLYTEERKYTFKTDTNSTANEWIRTLKKEIFRIRNDGDRVIIRLPLENLLEIEDSKVLGVFDALKLKVVESYDTGNTTDYILAFPDGTLGKVVPTLALRHALKSLVLSDTKDNNHRQHIASARKAFERVQDSTYSGQSSPVSMSPPMTPTRSRSLLSPASPGSPFTSIGKKVSRTLSNLVSTSRSTSPVRGDSSDDHEDGYHTPAETSLPSSSRKKHSNNFASLVSDKLIGSGVKHFDEIATAATTGSGSTSDKYLILDEDRAKSNKNFQKHFSFDDSEELIASYHAYIVKSIFVNGKIYVSKHYLCFRSTFPGSKTVMVVPLSDITNVKNDSGCKLGYHGIVVQLQDGDEIFFDFSSLSASNDAKAVISRCVETKKAEQKQYDSGQELTPYERQLRNARLLTYEEDVIPFTTATELHHTGIVETSYGTAQGNRPAKPMRFTLLTIGSRGDVQPYIALAKGLMKEGHSVKIASHAEFQPWVEKHGIEYAVIAGDPGELMKLMIQHGTFSVAFFKDAVGNFRSWIEDLLNSAWEACQGTDILIESPSAMGGIHIAEALEIPYYRAMPMPWTRTRSHPHAFMAPDFNKSGSYNYMSYLLFDNVFWKGIAGQVNKWRKEKLGLPKTNLDTMQQTKVPFMYNVSPHVMIPPVDFSDWIQVTGYWFLEEKDEFEPPADLVDFIKKAKDDGKKLVYIGFGSIVVPKPAELTKAVIESVLAADVRCILSKGWSDRYGAKDSNVTEVELPPEIHQISSAPHDWLFPQIDAAVHHGGSGTTGASLKAGLPTIIKPFFGDQFYYGTRVEELGAGIFLRKLTVSHLSKALIEATTNEKIIYKAAKLGKQIREEDGVNTAIAFIYRHLAYAKSLIKKRYSGQNNTKVRKSCDSSNDLHPILSDDSIKSTLMNSDKLGSESPNPSSIKSSPTSGKTELET